MDDSVLQAILSGSPWAIVIVLAGYAALQNRKIDEIRIQQINDLKMSIDTVSKSTDKMASAEERMVVQTEASKELLAVAKVLLNKGQVT